MNKETNQNQVITSINLLLVKSGAALILLSFLTGIFVSLAMTSTLNANSQTLLAAHLSGLIGALVLFSLSYCSYMLSYNFKWKQILAWLFIISIYSNWFITFVKAFLGVMALEINGRFANDFLHILLVILVVVPSIIGSFVWLRGFTQKSSLNISNSKN